MWSFTLPSDPSRFAKMSDPQNNRLFNRRWHQKPMTARELQHASDMELALGNARRASLLAWEACRLREEAGR